MNILEIIEKTDFMLLVYVRDNFAASGFRTISVILSYIGNYGAVWFLSLSVLFLFAKTRPAAFLAAAGLAVNLVLFELILKNIVCRPRPFAEYPLEFVAAIPHPNSYSFPSGHSLSSFYAAFTIVFCLGRKYSFFLLVAFLISLSRIVVMVHYPSDAAGGALIGFLTAVIAVRMKNLISRRFRESDQA